MICQDVLQLLDGGSPVDLDRSENKALSEQALSDHLSQCPDCARTWHTFEQVCDQPVPAMPVGLPARIWNSLQQTAQTPPRRRFPNRIVLAFALLLAGAATAMVLLSTWQRSAQVEEWSADSREPSARTDAPVTGPGTIAVSGEPPSASADADGVVPPDASAAADAETAADDLAEAAVYRLIVLPTQHHGSDQVATWIVDDIADAVVDALQRLPEPAVVVLGEQPAVPDMDDAARQRQRITLSSAGRDAELALALEQGGTHFMRIVQHASSGDPLMFNVTFGGPTGGDQILYYIGDPRHPYPSAESVGVSLARRVHTALFPDSSRVMLLADLMNADLSDRDRLRALNGLAREGSLVARELAAAVEFARITDSFETRAEVWNALGTVTDPVVRHPLVEALLYDAVAEVRVRAAGSLSNHIDDPNVSAALQTAAVRDPDTDVRLQARWQLMDDSDRRSLVTDALHDTSSSPDERMRPMILAYRQGWPALDPEYATLSVMVELARQGTSTEFGVAVIGEVQQNPAFVEFMLEALQGDDIYIRSAANHALVTHHRDRPDVLEALARALEAALESDD